MVLDGRSPNEQNQVEQNRTKSIGVRPPDKRTFTVVNHQNEGKEM